MISRLLRSAATVALVGGLSFAMPIAQAGADTNVLESLVATAGAGGGVGLVSAPEDAVAIGSVCATGVGCAVLAGVAVGAALYATQDTWVPWLRNAFGGSGTTSSGGDPAIEFSWGVAVSGDTATVTVTAGGNTIAELQDANMTCKNSSTGAVTGGDLGYQGNIEVGGSWGSPQTHVQTCGAGTVVYGYTVNGKDWDNHTAPTLTWGQGLPASGITVSNQVQCVNPDGSTFSVTQGVDGVTGGIAPMPTCTGAPGAQAGAHGQCVTTSAGPVGGALTVQSSNCAAVAQMQALYPNCVGVGAAACTYVVRVDGQPCAVGADGCVNWEATSAADPSRVACDYGPYVVPLANCDLLKRLYETGTTTATLLNTDGHPDTYSAPGPSGQPVDQPNPAPTPAPAPPGPQPNPTAPPVVVGTTTTPTTATEQNCWPSGFGVFNPASWVLQPVKCALSWAFVPSSTFLTGWSGGMRSGWSGSPFGQWLNTVGAFGAMNITSGGCQGPGLPTGFLGEGWSNGPLSVAGPPVMAPVIYPFSACSGVMATVAATSNLILTAGISFYGGMRVVQQLGYAFGFKVHVGSERGSFT